MFSKLFTTPLLCRVTDVSRVHTRPKWGRLMRRCYEATGEVKALRQQYLLKRELPAECKAFWKHWLWKWENDLVAVSWCCWLTHVCFYITRFFARTSWQYGSTVGVLWRWFWIDYHSGEKHTLPNCNTYTWLCLNLWTFYRNGCLCCHMICCLCCLNWTCLHTLMNSWRTKRSFARGGM